MARWAFRLAGLVGSEVSEAEALMPRIEFALRLLGKQSFRDGQLGVILAALSGESVLMVSATGSGKSLCFQLPTILSPGTAYVISPLQALMTDQAMSLHKLKIPATYINANVTGQERRDRYDMLGRGGLKFLYCAPERFDPTKVSLHEVEALIATRPSFLVVDEAHCIDRWGDSFRPAYGRLGELRKQLGNPPALMFTATAGRKIQERITTSLGADGCQVVVTGVDRPNIGLVRLRLLGDAVRCDLTASLLTGIDSGRAMIFVPTKKIGSLVQSGLRSFGHDLPFYHGRLPSAERDNILGRFSGKIEPAVRTVICTNAFGMGMDFPNVRLVIHWHHPASVEDYLQEFGRAGRDGKRSLAVLLTRDDDAGLLHFMAKKTVEGAELGPADCEAVLRLKEDQIRDMVKLARRDGGCVRAAIKDYFISSESRPKRPLLLRFLEWLFGEQRTVETLPGCCDLCDPSLKALISAGKLEEALSR
jgi:ATP-dependent DNA helicase RecQ